GYRGAAASAVPFRSENWALNRNISSHGKVFPLAPPPQASESVKERILDALKDRLENPVRHLSRKDEPPSGAGRDSAAPIDVRLAFNDIADILARLKEIPDSNVIYGEGEEM
ncbi:hypothetical protein FS837_008604, partial [Tulasnella sp. UAMH 9824]